jgi:putative addiction module antidote
VVEAQSGRQRFREFNMLACYNNRSYIASMVVELKLRKVGNSIGVVLPKEALARLNATEGDSLFLTETADGGLRVTSQSPEFARKMKVFQSLSRRYRNALRELAK